MKKVLVFNNSFFALSETFVHRQVLSLTSHFNLVLLAFRFYHLDKYPLPQAIHVQLNLFFKNVIDRLLTFVARRVFNVYMPFSFWNRFLINRMFQRDKIDVIHAHYGWNGIAILPYARRFNIPLVVSFHGVDASGLLRNKNYRERLIPLFEYAAAIVLCSSYMLKNLPLDNYRNKVQIIPFGIDVNIFKPCTVESTKDKLRILHAGRIVGKKGVPDLIRVFASLRQKYPFIELQIIGTGSELASSRLLVREKHLEGDVVFFDAQPNSFVLQAIGQCDVFVLNSRTDAQGDQEGLPNALLEAMSCGKAVLSTNHAGIPDAVQNSKNGLLVEENNNQQLYYALENLIKDKELRYRLGREARSTILKSFSLETMEQRLTQVLAKAITA